MKKTFNILFELTNTDSAMDAFTPVVRALRKQQSEIKISVVDFCAFSYRISDQKRLSEIFDEIWIPNKPEVKFHEWLSIRKIYKLPVLFRFRKSLSQELKKRKITFLIMMNDRVFPVVDLIHSAKQLDIPVMLIQESIRKDHVFGKRNIDFRTSLFQKWLRFYFYDTKMHGQGGCDVIAAWGKNGKEYFLNADVEEKRIFITGSSKMEYFEEQYSKCSVASVRKKYSLPELKKTILFTTNPLAGMRISTDSQYIEMIESVINIFKNVFPQYQLIIKPHRLELDFYKREFFGGMHNPNILFFPEMTLIEALVVSEKMIAFNSTTVLEAAYVKKSVGIINYFGLDYGVDFIERKLAENISNENGLKNFIENSHDGTFGDLDYYFDQSGAAGDRIADLIIKNTK